MGTIRFEAPELANIINVIAGPFWNDETAEMAQTLVKFSEVNTRAFNERYNENEQPLTLDEIKTALCGPGLHNGNAARAAGTLELAEYNCDGLLSDEVAAAMWRLHRKVSRLICDRLEQAREHIAYLNKKVSDLQTEIAAVKPVRKPRAKSAK